MEFKEAEDELMKLVDEIVKINPLSKLFMAGKGLCDTNVHFGLKTIGHDTFLYLQSCHRNPCNYFVTSQIDAALSGLSII